jgi:23S rRNA (uracil1939-C5)-methyltransferase
MKRESEHTILSLAVEGYGSDGEGVARLPDGMTCFVKGALRGETCRVRLDKVGRSCAWGTAIEATTPSPARLAPDCPYDALCGGCALRHMTYQEELAFKKQKVQDALRRIGGVDTPVSVIYGAENTVRYRNKVQFPAAPGPVIGFYRKGTHAVTDVDDCLLQPTACAELRRAVKGWMERYGVPAYDERAHTGLVRHVYVRTNAAGESLCCLLVNGPSLPREPELVDALRRAQPGLVGVVLGVNEKKTNVILGDSYRTLWGQDYLEETLCGLTFRLSVPSFFQVNRAQTEVLYEKALELAALTGRETALDLYCGIGTISLALAKSARRVIGAEVVPQAVADARANAARNGITNAEFFCGDAQDIAAHLADSGLRPDVVTVDPPRKGLAPGVVDVIAAMSPTRIVYISCDCATLARDLKRFTAQGYHPQTALAVDLFPRTSHVETVVQLSKGEIDSKKIRVEFSLEDMDTSGLQQGATYGQIKERVLEQTGLKVSSLYIAQVKQKCGIIERESYNKPKSEDARQPQCPPEKEAAIRETLKYFGMI